MVGGEILFLQRDVRWGGGRWAYLYVEVVRGGILIPSIEA